MKHAPAWLALAGLALACAQSAQAINQIHLRATSVAAADMQLEDVDATLQIRDAQHSTMEIRAARASLPQAIEAQTGALTALHLLCTDPVVREPRFECPALAVQVTSARWSAVDAAGTAGLRSDTGAWTATGKGLMVAGRPVEFAIEGDAAGMQAQLTLHGLQLPQVKEFLIAQQQPVPDLTYTGHADLDARLLRRDGRFIADIDLLLTDGGYQNTDFTLIGEKLAATAHATIDLGSTPITFEARVASSAGQALAGPVLLDFARNPLQFTASGRYSPQEVAITKFRSEQHDLAIFTGNATLAFNPLAVKEASIDATDVRFPAAYTSYLQILLATTPFNQLEATGAATLHAELRDNLPVQLDLAVKNLAFSDASRDLKVNGVNSEMHWTSGLTGPPRPSWWSWESSQGWGIMGAPSRLDFIVHDREFRLTQPARLPFFDGALRINTLTAEQIGTDAMSGLFDAVVEPISMAPIARALGLPEFAGKLSGRIPGLTYRDKVLALQGNLEADVFNGKLVASNLRIREPLGAWPRLYGDIVARNLDLGQLTSTFEIGRITGKLDIEVSGIETFDWSPVALELKLATSRGDHSRHRISQRAVQSFADISGGGGGVAAALKSPFLRFFEDFGYDRIGLACRLRNNVCQMSGEGPAKNGGFYIVRGKGVPRLDIIGNNALVDWPQFLSQVLNAIRNPTDIEVK